MRTLLLFYFLINIPLSPNVMGQEDSSLKAWLEKETFEETTLVRGFCENKMSSVQRMTYRFTMKIGGETEVRENKFLIRSGKTQALSKAVAFISSGEFDLIKLEIFQNEKLVAVDSLTAIMVEKEALAKAKNSKPKQKSAGQANTFSDLEIDGLIIDETRSKVAHNFYEYFYNKWYTPANVKGYLITIREMPSRGLASRISIEINGESLVERALEPRDEVLEQTAGQLVSAIQNHLQKKQTVANEIGNEDTSGSGIY
jgi:curli production assembly/transport component CsgE